MINAKCGVHDLVATNNYNDLSITLSIESNRVATVCFSMANGIIKRL